MFNSWPHPQSLELGHSLILLGRLPKQAPDSVSGPSQFLPQPDDLIQTGFNEVGHAQQAQRVASRGCVKDDPCEACVVLTPDKLYHLKYKASQAQNACFLGARTGNL